MNSRAFKAIFLNNTPRGWSKNYFSKIILTIEAVTPSKINIFLGVEGKSAFTEFHIIENLLRGNYQDALELLEENKNLLFNFHMLNNMPLFDSIREEAVFKNLLEQKKSEYSSLKEKYGNMEFLKILDNQ
ncbi:MAG: hypothetical protein IIB82_08895 [Bacteroidetes bacterium]|nr:hypothetical protein [Bacteroidota bacterium]